MRIIINYAQRYKKIFKYPNIFTKNWKKNKIFKKNRPKICKYEIFFVTLWPLRSVVRLARTFLSCKTHCKHTNKLTIIQ